MKFLVLDILGIYKAFLSPFLPPACRFEPSCSEYARQAVEKYGALRGTWMGVKRILRCQPLCKGGHDPVSSSVAVQSSRSEATALNVTEP
ncbi:MAG: membrane protein insertion efficiency factor YidD [Acidobacteria bacterium]|nr:membrane protein insertion efficiency factor YidD [Acidobacteriota bacterium]